MAIEKKIDYAILGLLSHESMTGYEIKKRIDSTLKFFWGASFGSIYPTLNGLVKDYKITKFETKENGREKVIYTITEIGKDCLKKWLTLPVEKDEIRYETLLKLFFGNEIGAEGTLSHIENFQNKIQKELQVLKEATNSLEMVKNEDSTHMYYLLTAMFGVRVYETYIKWCQDASKILKVIKNKGE